MEDSRAGSIFSKKLLQNTDQIIRRRKAEIQDLNQNAKASLSSRLFVRAQTKLQPLLLPDLLAHPFLPSVKQRTRHDVSAVGLNILISLLATLVLGLAFQDTGGSADGRDFALQMIILLCICQREEERKGKKEAGKAP